MEALAVQVCKLNPLTNIEAHALQALARVVQTSDRLLEAMATVAPLALPERLATAESDAEQLDALLAACQQAWLHRGEALVQLQQAWPLLPAQPLSPSLEAAKQTLLTVDKQVHTAWQAYQRTLKDTLARLAKQQQLRQRYEGVSDVALLTQDALSHRIETSA
ncbi:MAG: hypothetical protein ACKO34_07185 [Vampirovibrionales bacterium]